VRKSTLIIRQNYGFFFSSAIIIMLNCPSSTEIIPFLTNLYLRLRPDLRCFVAVFAIVLLPKFLQAQLTVNTTLRHESAAFTAAMNEFAFSRNLVSLGAAHRSTNWSADVSLQIRQSLLDSTRINPSIRLRQAYIEYSAHRFDLRVGRQIITWGRSEAGFNSDFITPLDLSEFLTQDVTDIRLGITSFKLTLYMDANALEIIVIPVPEMSELPAIGSRWNLFPDNGITITNTRGPTPKLGNTQYALRWIGRPNLATDIDLALFSGFNQVPALRKSIRLTPEQQFDGIQASYTYPRNIAFMLSGQYRTNSNLAINAEAVYWNQKAFDLLPTELRSGNMNQPTAAFFAAASSGFLIEKPFFSGMLGLAAAITGTRIDFQYQFETIVDFSTDILQDQSFHSFTLLATRSAMGELMQLRMLSRYNLNGHDFWINPDVTYDLADGLQLSAGVHAFAGRDPKEFYGHLSFQQFRNNTFAYMKLTAWW
jgi:hypothetical protein